MLTGAMAAMLENMLRDTVQNLPPDIQEKIGQAFQFIANVEARLAAIEAALSRIEGAMSDGKPVRSLEPAALAGPQSEAAERANTFG